MFLLEQEFLFGYLTSGSLFDDFCIVCLGYLALQKIINVRFALSDFPRKGSYVDAIRVKIFSQFHRYLYWIVAKNIV